MSVVLAIGAALLATSASAQTRGDRDDYGRGDRGWSRDSDDRGGGMRSRSYEESGSSMRSQGAGSQGGAGGSARFFLRSGDSRLAVRCDDRESMRSCVDAALMMFDRVKAQAGTTGTTSPSTGSSSPAPGSSSGSTTSPSR
jgi:hypothetical protein